jgi:hypothetical protein
MPAADDAIARLRHPTGLAKIVTVYRLCAGVLRDGGRGIRQASPRQGKHPFRILGGAHGSRGQQQRNAHSVPLAGKECG